MKEKSNHEYVKRTQKDYSMSFKLRVIQEVDSGELSVSGAQRKYGIHHSDRRIQYCCDGYQKVLNRKKVICSMTESYDPYANAVAERINGILKQEFLLEEYDVKLPVMKELVKDSIDIYNSRRPHYSCYMKTPEQMHKQDQIKIRSYKKTNRIRANLDTVS